MKNELLTLEPEVADKTAVAGTMGIAFDHANTVKAVQVEEEPEMAATEAGKSRAGLWATLGSFLKPSLSNLFLLGCLIGLFVLYCCSCIIHALKFPVRRKASS